MRAQEQADDLPTLECINNNDLATLLLENMLKENKDCDSEDQVPYISHPKTR